MEAANKEDGVAAGAAPIDPVAGAWKVRTIKASKARKHTRHWAVGPARQTCGWFSSIPEAQAYCDEQNAALAKAS